WRELRAATLDQPVRTVLPDLAILGIAQRAPRTLDDLRQCRGVDDRHTRAHVAEEILEAVRQGASAPPPDLGAEGDEPLDRHLRPAVTLVSAWVSQLARDRKVDTALLATRADLVDLLRDDPDARLLHGWRAEMLGEDVTRLVAGHAALAFDGRGNLRLVDLDSPPLSGQDGRTTTAPSGPR
ncbi:MAG TPA: HRDC domain-containing protein, partial [Acidimicrobiales bacterium]